MTTPVEGKRIVLGVSASIAAYKGLSLASRLTSDGAAVDVVLTRGAANLVTPLAFKAITHRPVTTSLWEPEGEMALDHLSLAHSADLLLIAPATANVIAQLALGLASDALTTTALAVRCPIVLAPAMEPDMWLHAATQQHVSTLQQRGVILVGPEAGRLASGKMGLGRLAQEPAILAAVSAALQSGDARAASSRESAPASPPRGTFVDQDMRGVKVLVTAGPTIEPIDPVRFLSNRSTGRMGFAVAAEAARRGATVTLIAGPTPLSTPEGVSRVDVERAAEMRSEVLDRLADIEVLVMTAAVADFRPRQEMDRKLKKDGAPDRLELIANPDILVDVKARLEGAASESRPVIVGFAAETDSLEENARGKLHRKGADLIVANRVPAAFGDGTPEAFMVEAGEVTRVVGDKPAIARQLLDRVVQIMLSRRQP